MLRVAAMSLIRSQTALTATARKLAILVYRTLTGTLGYQDPSCALGFSWTLDCERVLAGGVSR